MAATEKVTATKALRRNNLKHFTVGRVKAKNGSVSVGLMLSTSLHKREHVGAVACLEDGVLTELHIAT